MKALNLRLRVAAVVALTCLTVVGLLAWTLYDASIALENTLVEQIVNEEMTFLIHQHQSQADIFREPGPNVQYYIVRSSNDRERLPLALRDLSAGEYNIGKNKQALHVSVRLVDGLRLIVAYDSGQHEERRQQFKELLLIALTTIIFTAAGLGYWLAGIITHQITNLATQVAALDPRAAHEPLAHRGQDLEVATLARAFDQYQERIRDLIAREQEFTGNASHELRTPLTAIRTSCELLETEIGLSNKALFRVQGIASAAERMTSQLETLLFLARDLALDRNDRVALAECVNLAIAPWQSVIEQKGLRFSNHIATNISIDINHQALNLVLANILRNAVQYTEHGQIEVQWQAPILSIRDTGPGISQQHQQRVFDRRYRAHNDNDGYGLGLAIVKRACDHCGWPIQMHSASGGGTQFEITLPLVTPLPMHT